MLSQLRGMPQVVGTLELACERDRVRGGWSVGGELRHPRNLSLGAEDDRTEMLLWLASLLLETETDRSVGGAGMVEATPDARVPDVETPPATELAVGASPAEIRQPDARSADVVAPPASGAEEPAAREVLPAEESAKQDTSSGAGTERERNNQEGTEAAVEGEPGDQAAGAAELGLSYSYYGRAVSSALGPRLGGEILVSPPFGIVLAASFLWGTSEPNALQLTEGTLFAGGSWSPLPWARVMAGPMLSWVRLAEAGGEASRSSVTPGVEASVSVHWPKDGWAGFAQFGMQGRAEKRVVRFTSEDGSPDRTATYLSYWSGYLCLGVRFGTAGP